jgi:hypothetical protein
MKCRLDNDKWEDVGVEYIVHSYNRTYDSTAVTLELETPDGDMVTRVVAFHQIEWIDDED